MDDFNGIISVDDFWVMDDLYDGVSTKGARPKTAYFSPKKPEHSFIKPNHRYLFKKSRKGAPWQFWMEIIAYRIGDVLNVKVPPTYVGMSIKEAEDSAKPILGSLIEWFYGAQDEYRDGGRLIGPLIENFDYKTGEQHNLQTNLKIIHGKPESLKHLQSHFVKYWAKILTFDTIIGNTDRHQENWGLVFQPKEEANRLEDILSPAFDNGSALDYGVPERKFENFSDSDYAEKYLRNGKHHMKWSLDEPKNLNFFEFMKKFILEYHFTKQIVEELLQFQREDLEKRLNPLLDIEVPKEFRLSPDRLRFTIDMIFYRVNLLREALGTK